MTIGTYLSIIILNVNGLNAPTKDTDWLNGYKNKTHIYAVYKKLTLDLKTRIDWKWEDGTIYSMQLFLLLYLCAQWLYAAAAAKSLQSCPTLCNPTDGSPPGSPVPGILQARTLEWVAISFSNAWKWKVKVKSVSRVQPSATPWTAAFQTPLSMGFSRQEYWSAMPLPSPVTLY